MLKDFAWKAFEGTGNIEAYNFYKEIERTSKRVDDRKIAEEEAATTTNTIN